MAREFDYYALMKGIQELDFQGIAEPSDLVLIGSNAFPLSMNPRGQVLMAASRYGQGRIVVLGHEEYLIRFPVLVENALNWLMPTESENTTVGIQKSLISLAKNLSYSSLKTEMGDFKNVGIAVYVTDAYSVDSCAKELVTFLKSGGGLLIAGQACSWAQSHPGENTLLCFPGNKVCSVAGIYFSELPAELGKFPVPMQIPSSWLAVSIGKDFKDDLQFLLEGVSEFDVQGGALASEVMAHGPLAFPIALTPCGRTFIAGAYYGQGRIIVATHESYLGRDSLSTFLINAINWLDEGRKGEIGIIPQLKDAHRVLSKSGLNCQFSTFREDLSVFVCTSYDDSQRHQIKEFVAEGGGLMIGGHAWYWAQCHPHLNVMTDCPGNRILNKMGLCLMGNTLHGGLYKAQQLTGDGASATPYHFRDSLQRFASHVIEGQDLSKHDENRLQKLRNDCTSYLRMNAHDSSSYTSMVSLLTNMVKEAGVPQVCDTCPVKNTKDKLLLHVGSEVYKVCRDPDALLPYIISDIPDLPTVSNAKVRIKADTSGCEEWISTGLYLSPGMKTYIAVPPEIKGKGWQLQTGCQTDCLENLDVLKRAPVVHERFALDSDMVQVWNLWGGLLYLIAPPHSKVDGAEVIVQTAIEAPYYKSGQTSVKDWVQKIRSAPAPWAELEFENIIITLHSEFIRKLDRPDEVAALWDSIMKGVADLAAKPAKFPRKERFVADVQISHGYMHAGYPVMIHSESVAELVNPETARTHGIWGAIHELGHNQQRSVWEFPPLTTECTCNLWSVYVHEEVLGVNRAKAHPNMTPENRKRRAESYTKEGRKLENWSVWTALETYMQLQEKFGWDAFKKVFAAYHSISNVPNDQAGKMNLYAVTFSKVVNMNLAAFFKAWGWPIQAGTEETLSSLPVWSDHPMAQYA
ncbi:TRPM8 channel-associated factor homolog [Tachysurus fulvidraco]|uniref:TRPM8 channel-associated factor homolog n=1 Tax=Tachysurus fulvidraco TaxID=1234273 RepID=UPI000F51011C|nr:TRPM8 channel-associated factor homolog [Tachysurus fulvidraco]XP_027003018.1 TRPM8 channel-associated factor homolog [Tachysurus fulvidraco]XP_027003027.1 TRPM8 channel-associated factor homolog [Tachysurus fulvidraco]XP_027003034.1 TRPM8 channel-associated factor homolog [Tachysurus fulvidraco]XP_027003044.1 TRPM8 channel-associated factor homolog [Tachysurus fulvidraco]XP_027003053.1 TRPM8 channel-associated factor homolog [Tachysurus fulvidraco]XP_027003060.1 TRPM8 channel-associated f